MSKVYWFTGLSGSGKTTLAEELVKRLPGAILFDGDNVRKGLCADLGFSEEDRTKNIQRMGWIARLIAEQGGTTIFSFISPMREQRDFVRRLLPVGSFVEIHVSTPLSVCEQRDVKGLYAKARKGEIPSFTGVSAPYECPVNPEVTIDTTNVSVGEAVDAIMRLTSDGKSCNAMTSLLIGRWQCIPPHIGHRGLVDKLLEEGHHVVIGIRDIPRSEKNPFSVLDRMNAFRSLYGEKVSFCVIPEGSGGLEVVYGRDVGWGVREVRLPESVEKVSGTQERKKQQIGS